jgi:hypothetical protein
MLMTLTAVMAGAGTGAGSVAAYADTEISVSAAGEETEDRDGEVSGAAKDFSEVERLARQAETENKTGEIRIESSADDEGLNGAPQSADGAPEGIPMYRMYHPISREHLYTSGITERDTLVTRGWIYEGIGWYAPKEGKPVYRLVNVFTADHHYTTSEHERDALKELGWKYEGECWKTAWDPVYDRATDTWTDRKDGKKLVAVYRQFHPHLRTGAHNYTTGSHERDVLCGIGWVDEKVGFFASGEGKNLNELKDEKWSEIQTKLGVKTDGFTYDNEKVSAKDAAILGGIIYHEAGNHSEGMYCVGQVVLNRLKDYRLANAMYGRELYPSSIEAVIDEKNQFLPVEDLRDYMADRLMTAEAEGLRRAYAVAEKLLKGDDTGRKLIGGRKCFWSDWYAQQMNYSHCDSPVSYGGNTYFNWK